VQSANASHYSLSRTLFKTNLALSGSECQGNRRLPIG